MGVHVDEPRTEHRTGAINDLCRCRSTEIRLDSEDESARNADITL
jgi:hypothetical protein